MNFTSGTFRRKKKKDLSSLSAEAMFNECRENPRADALHFFFLKKSFLISFDKTLLYLILYTVHLFNL